MDLIYLNFRILLLSKLIDHTVVNVWLRLLKTLFVAQRYGKVSELHPNLLEIWTLQVHLKQLLVEQIEYWVIFHAICLWRLLLVRFILRRFYLLELFLVIWNSRVHDLLKNVSDLCSINHGVVLKLKLSHIVIINLIHIRHVYKIWFGFLVLIIQNGLNSHFLTLGCFIGLD